MSEIVWREDVVDLQEIDETDKYGGACYGALIPNVAGTLFTEIVTGTQFTTEQTATLNSDGSVTGHTSAEHSYATLANTKLPNPNNKHLIIVLDYERIGSIANQDIELVVVKNYLNAHELITVKTAGYSAGTIHFAAKASNSTSTFGHSGGSTFPRSLFLMHHDVAAGTYKLYVDGVEVSSTTRTPNSWDGDNNEIRFGLGCDKDKLFMSAVYLMEDFTEDDVKELTTNPYRAFKDIEDKRTEKYLEFDGALSQVIETNEHLDIDFINDSFFVEFESTTGLFNGTICAHNLASNGAQREFQLWAGSAGQANIYIGGAASTKTINADSFSYAGVHRIESIAGIVDLYRDGALIATGFNGKNGGDVAESYATFTIGARHDGTVDSYNFHLTGGIKWLRIGKLDGSYTRTFDFDQDTFQSYVTDLETRSTVGTLLNFPTIGGRVREKGSHEGVTFDGNNGVDKVGKLSKAIIAGNQNFKAKFKINRKVSSGELFGQFSSTGRCQFGQIGNDWYMGFGDSSVTTSITANVGQVVEMEIRLSKSDGTAIAILDGQEVYNGSMNFTENSIYIGFGRRQLANGTWDSDVGYRSDMTILEFSVYDRDTETYLANIDFTTAEGNTLVYDSSDNGNDVILEGITETYYRPAGGNEIIAYRGSGMGDQFLPPTEITTFKNSSWRVEAIFALHEDISNHSGFRLVSRTNNDQCRLMFGVSADDRVNFKFRPSTSGSEYIAVAYGFRDTLSDGNFHHYVITKIDDTITVSVDGNEIASLTDPEVLVAPSYDANVLFDSAFDMSIKSIGLANTHDGEFEHFYDYTLDDTDQILDTAGGNHAAISNVPTTGFVTYIDKHIFTVGNNGWGVGFGNGKNILDGTGIVPVLKHFTFETEVFIDHSALGSYARLLSIFHTHIRLEEGSSNQFIYTSATRSTHGTGSVSTSLANGLYVGDGTKPVKITVFSGNNDDGKHTIRLWVNDVFVNEKTAISSCYTHSTNNYFSLGAIYNENRSNFDFRGHMKYFKISGYETEGGQLHEWYWNFGEAGVALADTLVEKNGSGYTLVESGTLTKDLLVDPVYDYSLLNAAVSGVENPTEDVHHELLLYGTVWSNNGNQFWDNNNDVNYQITLKAGDNYFEGVQTNYHMFGKNTGSLIIYDHNMRINIEGLQIKGATINMQGSKVGTGRIWRDCLVDGQYSDNSGYVSHFCGSDAFDYGNSAYNCVITNFRTSADRHSQDVLVDCIFWNCGGQYADWEVINTPSSSVHNAIIGQDSSRYNYGTTTVKALVSSHADVESVITFDANHSDAIMQNVDVGSDVLEDPNNGDFRIKEAFQSNLTGTGLFGTNILESYWSVAEVVDGITGTITTLFSQLYAQDSFRSQSETVSMTVNFQNALDALKLNDGTASDSFVINSVVDSDKVGLGQSATSFNSTSVELGDKTGLGDQSSNQATSSDSNGDKSGQGDFTSNTTNISVTGGDKSTDGTASTTESIQVNSDGLKLADGDLLTQFIMNAVTTGIVSSISELENYTGTILTQLGQNYNLEGSKSLEQNISLQFAFSVLQDGVKSTHGETDTNLTFDQLLDAIKSSSSTKSTNESYAINVEGHRAANGVISTDVDYQQVASWVKSISSAVASTGIITDASEGVKISTASLLENITYIVEIDGMKLVVEDIDKVIETIIENNGTNIDLSKIQIGYNIALQPHSQGEIIAKVATISIKV